MADIRVIEPGDAGRAARDLHGLNERHAEELSRLAPEALADLIAQAFLALRAGDHAFLIALDERADYASPNFVWFRERFDRFVYVDRVAVAAEARGRGLARALYETLFRAARAAGHVQIVAEVNEDPPNPASDAFHAALGFAAIGAARLPNGKAVRYFARPLGDAGA